MRLSALVLAFAVVALSTSACLMPPPSSSGQTAPSSGSYASSGGGADGADGTSYGAPASSSSSGSGGSSGYGSSGADGSSGSSAAPAGPKTVSVTIRSSCSKTVGVFYGDNPGFSSGTKSSVSSNSVSSKTFTVGDKMWVLDDSGKGASSITISEGTRNVEINSSCSGLSG